MFVKIHSRKVFLEAAESGFHHLLHLISAIRILLHDMNIQFLAAICLKITNWTIQNSTGHNVWSISTCVTSTILKTCTRRGRISTCVTSTKLKDMQTKKNS